MFKYILAFLALSAPLNAATFEPDSTVFIYDYTTEDLFPDTGFLGQAPLTGQSLTLRFGVQFSGLSPSPPTGSFAADYATNSFSGFMDAWILTPGWSRWTLSWVFDGGLPSITGQLYDQYFANSLTISPSGDDWQPEPDRRYFSSGVGNMALVGTYFSCQFICGAPPPPLAQVEPPLPPTNVPVPAAGWLLMAALAMLARSSGGRPRDRWPSRSRCSA